MRRIKKRTYRGFTLIELVIVITILAILAAVAIPAFQNLTAEARNAGTRGALGGLRSAIAIYRANELVNDCDPAADPTDCYPSLTVLQAGTPMENETIPENPWGVPAGLTATEAGSIETATQAQADARTVDETGAGWRYFVGDNPGVPNGLIYANTSSNNATALENSF